VLLVTELERWRIESRIEEVERVSPNTPLFPEKVVGVGKGNMGERTEGGYVSCSGMGILEARTGSWR
jgi:hypothetical protein